MFCFKTSLNCRTTMDIFSTTHELNCPTDGGFLSKINIVVVKHKHNLSYFREHHYNDKTVTMSCWRGFDTTFTITI